jgi:hypothetical protein
VNSTNTSFKTLRRVALVLCVWLAGSGAAQAASRSATLEAIHHLENPQNSSRPGKFGELGAYQFRYTTWRLHTSLPHRDALDRRVSDIIAVQHYEYLKGKLEAANRPATTYNIALAWNGGLTAAIKGTAPKAARAYAQRAANLAAVLDQPVRAQLVAVSQ